jgi:hypothetical protein
MQVNDLLTLANIATHSFDVRFTPENRHSEATVGCPLCAKSGHHTYEGLSNSKTANRPGGSWDSTIGKRSGTS